MSKIQITMLHPCVSGDFDGHPVTPLCLVVAFVR